MSSYKVANVYTEMSLKTNKESVRDFQNQFSGAINNLKQGIAGIGPAGINSIQGLSSIGGSIGNAATGIMGAGGPLVAGLGALTGAIASVVSIINSKSKAFKSEFEQDTSMIADMIDKAEGLEVTVGEYQKLKVFAQLKGMDFKQLEQTMLQLNLLSAKVQELGEDADEQTRIYAKIMNGDGKKYSNFQRLELLLRGITHIRETKGQEIALRELKTLLPRLGNSPGGAAALSSGVGELYEADKIKVNNEVKTKKAVAEGRKTIALAEHEKEYNTIEAYNLLIDDNIKNFVARYTIDENKLIKQRAKIIETAYWMDKAASAIKGVESFLNRIFNNGKQTNNLLETIVNKQKEKLENKKKHKDLILRNVGGSAVNYLE